MPDEPIYPLPFPSKGLHRGEASASPPPGTSNDMLNVRARSVNDRFQGGKRPGTKKSFAEQIGSATLGRRINHLQLLRYAQSLSGCIPDSWVNVKNGLNTNGSRLMGYNPGTLLHIIGDFTTTPSGAERFATYDTLTGVMTGKGNSFSTSVDWPCGLLVSSVGGSELLWAAGGTGATPTLDGLCTWNGSTWTDRGGSGINGAVHCIAEFSGSIYIGGAFTTANGVACNRVARYTGSTFEALGTGLDGTCYALLEFDGELYAAGAFTDAGGTAVGRIAKWNGSTWSVLTAGAGLNGDVFALTEWNDKLYIGGRFSTADGEAEHNLITVYDGTSFEPLIHGLENRDPAGTDNGVYAMDVYNYGTGEGLWCVGRFQRASSSNGAGVAVPNIAVWDGSKWFGPRRGVNGAIRDIEPIGTALFKKLYITGTFSRRNVRAANGMMAWDGGKWDYVGGAGLHDGGSIASPKRMAIRAGSLINSGGVEQLFVGGIFVDSDVHGFGPGEVDNPIAAWTGQSWLAMGDGLSGGGPHHATIWNDGFGNKLFVTGTFTGAGISTASPKIAAWNGSEWEDLGTGLDDGAGYVVFGVSGYGALDGLYIGGTFTGVGGVANTNKIAKWNGAAWESVFSLGFTGTNIMAMAIYNGSLIIAGKFTEINGVACENIVSWDGTTVTALLSTSEGPRKSGSAANAQVKCLAVFLDELYLGGDFDECGNNTNCNHIAKWDGSSFTDLRTGTNGIVSDMMATTTVGNEPSLFVSGIFTQAGTGGSESKRAIAKWDGSAWSKIDGTVNGGFNGFSTFGTADGLQMDLFNGRLILGGNFAYVGGQDAKYLLGANCGDQEDLNFGEDPGALDVTTGGDGTGGGGDGDDLDGDSGGDGDGDGGDGGPCPPGVICPDPGGAGGGAGAGGVGGLAGGFRYYTPDGSTSTVTGRG